MSIKNMPMNESEKHFARFCRERGLLIQQIPRSRKKSPDFEISNRVDKVVAEIKQFEYSQCEKKVLSAADESGFFWGSRDLSIRMIGKAKKGIEQLNSWESEKHPRMLVFEDLTGFGYAGKPDLSRLASKIDRSCVSAIASIHYNAQFNRVGMMILLLGKDSDFFPIDWFEPLIWTARYKFE